MVTPFDQTLALDGLANYAPAPVLDKKNGRPLQAARRDGYFRYWLAPLAAASA
jgi:hypothetical protein